MSSGGCEGQCLLVRIRSLAQSSAGSVLHAMGSLARAGAAVGRYMSLRERALCALHCAGTRRRHVRVCELQSSTRSLLH